MKLRLVATAGPLRGHEFELDEGVKLSIGRDPDATISVVDINISRRHCEIARAGTTVRVLDLRSTNGTFVNDARVSEAILRDGDEIRVGRTVLRLEVRDPAARRTMRAAPSVRREEKSPPLPASSSPVGDPEAASPLGPGALPISSAAVAEPEAQRNENEQRELPARPDEEAASPVPGTEEIVSTEPSSSAVPAGEMHRIPVPASEDRPPLAAKETRFPLPIFESIEPTLVGVPAPSQRTPLLQDLSSALGRRDDLRLYAIVDGAQDLELAVHARLLGHELYTLFEGEMAPSLAHVGPCLIPLTAESTYLSRWTEALGKNAGVLIQASGELEDLARHLREIFVVKDEDGQEYFFRYYDPRVLRAYLPTCTPAELAEVFGPIERWIAEDAEGSGYQAHRLEETRGALVSTPGGQEAAVN